MKWAVDPNHSSVSFTIRHLMSKVRGEMALKEGWIETESNGISNARVEVVLDAATIDTGVEARDNHLRSADGHFDVASFPTVTFKSTRIAGKDPSNFKVIGDLTIHGVTKEVVLDVEGPSNPVKDPWGNTRVAASATTKVNRQDYGVKWNANIDGGGVVVGDDVNITIDLEMTKKVPK